MKGLLGGKLDKLRLKWKIFLFLLGFCGLLLVMLWLFQTVFLSDMYKAVRRTEMEKAIALVEQNLENGNLATVISQLKQEKEILVSNAEDFEPPQKKQEPGGKGRPEHETLTETRTFTRTDGSQLSLTFHAMISPVDATVNTLRIQLYVVTAVMLMLAVLLAVLIAGRVARPIEDINRSAKRLGVGNHQVEFRGTGFLEISELSHTLNTAAAELSKVETLRKELMANISHDLRTPLALIYSYAEMMHDFPEEITPEQTQVIKEEAQRLTGLVNDVFEISKLETGNQELHCQTYNLTEEIAGAIARMEALVKKDGFTISFHWEESVLVFADSVKIGQVFYNLLINAVNYSNQEKQITVRQLVKGPWVRIQVEDKGSGIAPENLPYIWDRYYKEEKSHKRGVTGSGLGLSIVKKMITLHGGTCGVQSEPGQGSCFWFELKIKETV